jgi:hypothetical protein
MKALALSVAAMVSGTPALAQSFNIDVGDPAFPSPAMTYAAGSAQAGVWNAWGDFSNGIPWTQPLVDISGAATGVTMTGDYSNFTNGLANFSFDNANTFGDDEALLDDLWDMGAPPGEGWFTIMGLADGDYDIYSYAFAPDNAGFSTTIMAMGSPDPPQLVNDPTSFGGGHGLGVTYAKHRVTVSGGSNVEVFFLTTSGFGSHSGMQITPAAGNPICDDGGQSGNYCNPGGTFTAVGVPATISAPTSVSIASGSITLVATNLIDQPGQFISANGPLAMPFANYMLCVDTVSLQRLLPVMTPSGGVVTTVVNFANGAQTATGTAPVNVLAGTTHYFQRWNREPGVGANSNLTNAIAVCMTP